MPQIYKLENIHVHPNKEKMRKHEMNNRVKRSRTAFKQRDCNGSEKFYTVFSLFAHYCQKENFRKKESCSAWKDSDTMSV